MPWLNNMNAAHLTSINKTSIMNRPIHPKPIIVIFFCIFYLTAHCQQDLFNLDFRFAEPLHFQWKATQIPIINTRKASSYDTSGGDAALSSYVWEQ